MQAGFASAGSCPDCRTRYWKPHSAPIQPVEISGRSAQARASGGSFPQAAKQLTSHLRLDATQSRRRVIMNKLLVATKLWSLLFRCPLRQPPPAHPCGFATFQRHQGIRKRTPSIIRSSLPNSGARVRTALASSTIATPPTLTTLPASRSNFGDLLGRSLAEGRLRSATFPM